METLEKPFTTERPPTITTEDELRDFYRSPRFLPVLDQLDRTCRLFIEHSPMVIISTFNPDVGIEISPRGDPPGFVRILDDYTLVIPDRTGNNRLDCMTGLLVNDEIGLFFVVPGLIESLRIKGTAVISRDPALLAAAVLDGKEPKTCIVVTVRECFFHCGKAISRSRVWHDDYRADPKAWRFARGTLENSATTEVSLGQPIPE